MKAFAKGLKQDYAAVKAGLTYKWSQGQVEGQINRLKTVKRANVRSGQSRSAKSASVESNLITVRKIGSGSSIALHQLPDRTISFAEVDQLGV